MNLHIEDKPENLEVINEFQFGGYMYGLSSTADEDIMILYKPSRVELLTPFNNHHVFQHTTEIPPEDRIYTTPQKFFANLSNGDSLVNFEIFEFWRLFEGGIFYSVRDVNFVTKKLLRAFVGFIKKDIKKFHKESTEEGKDKCLRHIDRGTRLLRHLYTSSEDRDYIVDILTSDSQFTSEKDLKELSKELKALKPLINKSKFPDYISIEDQVKISSLCNSLGFCETHDLDLYLEATLDANINPQINYSEKVSANKRIIQNIVKTEDND